MNMLNVMQSVLAALGRYGDAERLYAFELEDNALRPSPRDHVCPEHRAGACRAWGRTGLAPVDESATESALRKAYRKCPGTT